MIRGAQEWAWEHDHMLLVVNTGGRADVEAAAAAEMVRRRVDGVLYAAMYTRRVSVPAEVKDLPLVLANGFQDEHPEQVLPDERSGGRAAASALIDAGHRAVAFIGGDTGLYAYDLREAAFREILTEAGLDLDERLIRRVHARADGGYEVATDLLKNHELTGIVCGNDRIAMGVYDAARGLGLVVPDDVSVVGYDDQSSPATCARR
jgi:LacI family transcriptional regulator